jgi:hypothetical protein
VWGTGYAIGSWAGDAITSFVAPIDHTLDAVAGVSPDEVVAVGDSEVVTLAGGDVTVEDLAPDGYWLGLRDVAGGPDGSLYAGGFYRDEATEADSAAFYVRNAGTWEPLDATMDGSILALWVAGADDVYALAWPTSQIVHWDGAAWTTLADAPDATAIWGRSDAEIYVASDAGGVSVWDGATLTPIAGAPASARDVVGTADALYVVSYEGDWVVSRYADGAWSEVLRTNDTPVMAASGDEVAVLYGETGMRLACE